MKAQNCRIAETTTTEEALPGQSSDVRTFYEIATVVT